MLNKNMKSILLAGTIIVMSLTACAKQSDSQPSDNKIREVVQNYITASVDDTAKITSFVQSEVLAADEVYEVLVDAAYDGNQGMGQTTLDITFSPGKRDWWVSKMVVRSIEKETNTLDSQSESIEDVAIEENEDKLSEEILEQLDKLSLVAESKNGKASIYAGWIFYEDFESWVSDIYLLYNNNLRKLPYGWFTKYTKEKIAVECRDFDGDGADEIAIMKSCTGGMMIDISDVVFIENPGTDMEHHYIYNTSLDEFLWPDDYKMGDYQVDDYQLTGIHVDIYDYIEEYVKSDGLNYYIIGIREKNSGYDIELFSVLSDDGSVFWNHDVENKITQDGFDVMNTPQTYFEGGLTDWSDACMCFKYLGDGKIQLNNIY